MACRGCQFLPPFMVDKLNDERSRALEETPVVETFRSDRYALRTELHEHPDQKVAQQKEKMFKFYNAEHKTKLPGKVVKTWDDQDVIAAYNGAKLFIKFLKDILNRDSLDGKGMRIVSTTHYGKNYPNAYWDGEKIVYGDTFSRYPTVVAHELAHGVTHHMCNLTYEGDEGAEDEAVADFLAVATLAYAEQLNPEQMDWLIGKGLLGLPALRSMKDPGSAFKNHRIFGDDPQPKHMSGYVKTEEDNGGVHINSGILNHMLYLFTMELWTRDDQKIWQIPVQLVKKTMEQMDLEGITSFKEFGDLLVKTAMEHYKEKPEVETAIRTALKETGIYYK